MERKTSYIISWNNAEFVKPMIDGRPLNWPAIFGNDRPLDLEIGIGNGSFLIPFAAAHPDRNIVGIEIDGYYLKKADRRLVRQQLSNARLMIGDAKLLLWGLFPDEAIEDLYLLFPDPWFKKRHKKRRMIQPITIRLFARKIRRYLNVSTDDEEYKDWVLECISASGCFTNAYEVPFVDKPEEHYPTKYEKKWRQEGKPVYYMRFRKTRVPEVDDEEYIRTQNLHFALSRLREKWDTQSVLSV